jgi:hypothetical protein
MATWQCAPARWRGGLVLIAGSNGCGLVARNTGVPGTWVGTAALLHGYRLMGAPRWGLGGYWHPVAYPPPAAMRQNSVAELHLRKYQNFVHQDT